MSSRDEEELPGNGNPENDFNDRRAIFLVPTVANTVRFVFGSLRPRHRRNQCDLPFILKMV